MTLIVSLPPCPGATAWDGLPGHGGATACTHLVRRRSLPFTKGRVADWRSQADGWGALPERAPPVSLLTQRATLPASRRRDKRSIAAGDWLRRRCVHPAALRVGGISAQSPALSLDGQEMCECGATPTSMMAATWWACDLVPAKPVTRASAQDWRNAQAPHQVPASPISAPHA